MAAEKTQFESDIELKESFGGGLILFNDDFNTFDFVIQSLIEICHHNQTQAEQCAFLVHYKGKCAVKSGTYEELLPMYTALSNRNLTVELKM